MQPLMTGTPLVDVARPVRLGAGRTQQPVLRLVPVLRGIVDPVPRELVDQHERCERRELVEALAERVHVMEHAPGDDGVEVAVDDLLERTSTERLALGCLRIDAECVVAGVGEQRHETALPAATDLEHAPWRRRQLL